AEYERAYQEAFQNRSCLAVPMLRDGRPIGAMGVGRHEVRPFTPKQIALLQTFADQAVIAIENVRLFNETKEALDRHTATSEILRVISQSPTDVEPVFETIVQSALRLSLLKIRLSQRSCVVRSDRLFGRSWSDGLGSFFGHSAPRFARAASWRWRISRC